MTQPIARGLHRCHHPTVSSVVLREGPFMRRAFVADGPSGSRTVAPHSHRTSLRLTVLRGFIAHHTFTEGRYGSPVARRHSYRSPLLGGEGLSKLSLGWAYAVQSTTLHKGDHVVLAHDQIHTVEWSDNAVWLVDEGPTMTEDTTVLIRPGLDRMDTDGLYVPMEDDVYRDRLDLVRRLAAGLGVTP